MEINVYDSDLYGTRCQGTVALVYLESASTPVCVIENIFVKGVDLPDDEWYDLTNAPQWLVDLVVEKLRPVVDAFTHKFNNI